MRYAAVLDVKKSMSRGRGRYEMLSRDRDANAEESRVEVRDRWSLGRTLEFGVSH